MNLVTTCPTCGTVFRMVREQLDVSDGWVRCGHCMAVFDAKLQLLPGDNEPDAPPLPSQLSFEKKAASQAFWRQPWVRLGLIVLVLVLLVMLVAQVLRSERDRLTLLAPSFSKMADKLCLVWACQPMARLQLADWLLDSSSFQKVNEHQYALNLVLKNNGTRTLLVPHLDVSLLGGQEALVIRKAIDLSTDHAGHTLTALGGEERKLELLLSLQSGIDTITGYRLVLFYP